MQVICFDLEGPLSPQDNAYEVLGLVKDGEKIFEVISKYDDVLTLEGRKGYEPGDTLKLIVPFLIYHNITEEAIKKVSSRAKIVDGAGEVVSKLKAEGWRVYIISTSYQQHAFNIARQIGVVGENIACTKMPLDAYVSKLRNEDFTLIEEAEGKILNELYPEMDEERIVEVLDEFFFDRLLKTRLGEIFNEVTVIGGQRKVDAMLKFADSDGVDLSQVIPVGDSITDYKMLKTVREAGGVAVVFNGNEYAVPYANVALATTDQRFLLAITSAFSRGGKEDVFDTVKQIEGSENDLDVIMDALPEDVRKSIASTDFISPVFNYMEGAGKSKIKDIIDTHKRFRTLVRGEAGKLG
jgi:energy-converting hydrogenase A subunit R